MISKKNQRRLALYFAAMICFNGLLVWRCRGWIAIGLPDFSIFYTAASIVSRGDAARLYDPQIQEAVQRSFSELGIRLRGAVLPYNHPPFEALLFEPLARFSYLTAYCLWLAVNLALLLGLAWLLGKHFAGLGLPLYLWRAALLAFYPIVWALLQGQDSILLLFCYAMSCFSLRRDAEFRAGVWLGLGLFKFQLGLPFVVPFFLLKRSRFVLGFVGTAIVLVLIGFAAVGWSGWLTYPRYVLGSEQYHLWSRMPNLRGLVLSFATETSRIAKAVLLILSATLLVGLTYAWHRAYAAGAAFRQLAFGLTLVSTVLLSYHIYIHDFSLLFLAIAIVLEALLSGVSERVKTGLYLCMAALFSPIYAVLSLRGSQQLPVAAAVLIIFYLLLLIPIVSEIPGEAEAASSAPRRDGLAT